MKREKTTPILGETWLTRYGMHISIIRQYEDGTLRGLDDRKTIHKFYQDGSYLGPTYIHSMDLMTKL
jgi:hypothetical protein